MEEEEKEGLGASFTRSCGAQTQSFSTRAMPAALTQSPDVARNLTPSTLPDPGSRLELSVLLAIVHTHAHTHTNACTHSHGQPQSPYVPGPNRMSSCVPCVHTEDMDTFHTQRLNNSPHVPVAMQGENQTRFLRP